jgi:hypothetical protein
MKLSIALVTTLLMAGLPTTSADKASAMVFTNRLITPPIASRGLASCCGRASDARGSAAGNADEPCRPGGSGRQALTHHAASLAGIDRGE